MRNVEAIKIYFSLFIEILSSCHRVLLVAQVLRVFLVLLVSSVCLALGENVVFQASLEQQ